MKVQINELKELSRKTLLKLGYLDEEAQVLLDVLMYAQLRGNTQGIAKIVGNGIPPAKVASPMEVTKETKLSVLINSNQTNSMIVMNKIVEMLIDKAREHGFGIGGNNNSDSSSGAIGYFVRKIAEKGLIGMAFASGPFPLVAPHGSYQARFCTNPLAIGIPTDGEPIVLDMATGAISYFGLIEAKAAGRSIPDNTCYDIAGKVTTSPEDAMKGAIMTFDRSYKGSALAMMVQILAGPLIDVDYFDAKSTNSGNLIIAIDPEILVDGDVFKKNVSDLSAKVKESTKLKGVDEIFLPGERGDNLTNERLASGEIEVEDNLYQELEKLANAV